MAKVKVYLLICNVDGFDEGEIGVFSTREKAEEALGDAAEFADDYRIQEAEVR